ncbi:hypothetical protein O3Q51_00340 [Cryomorphaceae bacterium 1068]|nr:hypothetical protein [Cryomorphaceae bacterium 1068]
MRLTVKSQYQMKTNGVLYLSLLLISLLAKTSPLVAHPTGNIALYKGDIYWPYVHPIDNKEHHSCVMVHDESGQTRVFFTSDYSASDFMLYADRDLLYLLERRFIRSANKFEFRILRYQEGGEVELWWDWAEDKWHVGEGGFSVESEHSIVFVRYPEIYRMGKNQSVEKHFKTEEEVSRMKRIPSVGFILNTETGCLLVNENGEILSKWEHLIQEEIDDPPLGRNTLFAADYNDGNLIYAYWGKRTFERIDPTGEKSILLSIREPFAPHWIAFCEKGYLLFSSSILAGKNPRPQFFLITPGGEKTIIWEELPE